MKTLVSCLLMAVTALTAPAVNLVVPNNNALVEGGYNNALPFADGVSSLHYQQIYDASQFTALGTNGGRITALGFRWIVHANSKTIPYSLTLRMSTTPVAVDNLTTNFAANFGADNVIVYSSIYSLTPPSLVGTPWPFPTVIPLSTSYFYNPANGNLLLDIQISHTSVSTVEPLIDAVLIGGDSVSRARKDNYNTSVLTDSVGMVTEFGVTPVVAPAPRISCSAVSGDQVILTGTGGAAGLVYCLLASTNLDVPVRNWSCVGTNAFGAAGEFSVTNTLDLTAASQYFVVQIQ